MSELLKELEQAKNSIASTIDNYESGNITGKRFRERIYAYSKLVKALYKLLKASKKYS